jgi:type IV pilus assembly protein PilV
MLTGSTAQRGVGLIEVMIALFILTFGALAIGNVQMTALSSVTISSSHYAISSITEEIAEQLKADSDQAAAGSYNTLFSEAASTTAMPVPVAGFIDHSKQATAAALSDGALQIDCAATACTVSLRWTEPQTGSAAQQFYNLRFPL